ncbi:MAG: ribose-phosphate pyrophosphokinase [Bacteroidales bacterium]|nr:ribose-phosphate pyrophosphokinase [Bacteroidales bacterium]MDY0315405.1 ribose-phosphate pyrophosphokinase [Bacteroidales bacterium]
MQSPIKFFSGSASSDLAIKIINGYNQAQKQMHLEGGHSIETLQNFELGKSSFTRFSDGEFVTSLDETVRGCTVFLIQSTFPPIDNLFELMLMVDAAKRASAYKVVAVIPYFGFARQDRKDQPRVAIGAKLIADLLAAAKVDRIMTMDLHADQIQGFFNMPVDHIYASALFVPYLKSLNLDNLVIASPDMGGSKRAKAYSHFLGCEMAIAHKSREKANEIGEMIVIGDVENKNVIITDDMVDTAGTIAMASDIMMDKGAKSVRVVATHPVLSGPAYERINKSSIIELITTDSIPIKEGMSDKIKTLSIGPLFGDIINKVYNFRSISGSFIV